MSSKKKAVKKETSKKVTPVKNNIKKTIKKTKDKSKPREEKTLKKKQTKKEKVSKIVSEMVTSEKSIVKNIKGAKKTPNIFKIKSKNTPIVFTLDEVQKVLQTRIDDDKKGSYKEEISIKSQSKKVDERPSKKLEAGPIKQQILGAATLTDILGFNPKDKKSKPLAQIDEDKIPKKWIKYYKILIDLRNNVKEGLDMHTRDTLKRSSKDDSGDLSSYSQHMADAGTDTFDRDFALSLVSNEQDILFEIEEAIQRILDGSYGICEITRQPIDKERLLAVPFTRYSLEGQRQLESKKRGTSAERGGIFSESNFEYPDADEDSM